MNQKRTFLSLCSMSMKASVFLLILFILPGKAFAQQVLYAINGYNSQNGTLYKLNASNGSIVATVGNTGLSNVTNMTVDPISGQIYVQASRIVDSQMNMGQPEYLWQGFLYTVDSLTAVATQIDTTTGVSIYSLHEPPYIIFSPAGGMYTIDLACHCVRDQIGVSFDNICHLFFKDEFYLSDVDTATGDLISFVPVNGMADNMFAVDINSNFYSGQRVPGDFILKTIDQYSGLVTTVGSALIPNMAAIAFGPYRPTLLNPASISFCAGGAAVLMAPQGDTYQWKLNGNDIQSATSQTYAASLPGSYSVEVTIGCGKYASSSTIINNYPLPVLATNVTNVNCFGNNNGIVDLTVTGSAVTTYNWSNGAGTEDISALSPGTYSVTVTDVNNCQSGTSATISQPNSALSATSGGQTNATSGNNGTATVTASGGTAPYYYSWSPSGGTNATASGLGAGTYTATVTDANGCTAQQVFTITQACNVSFTANVSNVSCNGANNGAIDVTITSGPGQYTYSWSNGATTQDLTNRPAGTYTLTVSSSTGCTQTQSFTITEPAPITITAVPTNVSCYNAQNGSIDISVSGGTAPYTYVWADVNSNNLILWMIYYYGQWCNNGNYNGWPGSNIHSQDRTGLDNGCYYIKVTDANGCTAIANFTITQPSPICVSNTKVNAGCANNNGSINQTVSCGTAPYTYVWNNGATTEDVSGLSAGTHSVLITDANGCTSSQSYSISQATANITVSCVNKTNALCASSTGLINISVSGGSAPYSYLWSNGATTQDINNIPAGSYTVNITDANGCVKSQSYSISSTSGNICVSSNKTNAGCANNNGSITQTISSGTAPYTYLWSNGATTKNVSGLSAGTYTVVITDANGCTSTQAYTLSQATGNISVTANKTNALCTSNTGTINISVSGGSAPYTYLWSNGATTQDINNIAAGSYTVNITDAGSCVKTQSYSITSTSGNICVSSSKTNANCANTNGSINISVSGGSAPYSYQWSNGATTQDASNLSSGTYTVNITDANGCASTQCYTIGQSSGNINVGIGVSPQNTVSGQQAYTIFLGYGPQSVTLSASISGGTAPYTRQWSSTTSTSSSVSVSPTSTTVYTLTVTDANGCTAMATRTIIVKDVQAPNGKIYVCHNGTTTAVTSSQVYNHLCHGDDLGQCGPNAGGWCRTTGEENDEPKEPVLEMASNQLEFNVYPNPTTGVFNIDVPVQGDVDVVITDISGRVVERRSLKNNTDQHLKFNMSDVSKGVYMVRLSVNGQTYQSKVNLQ